MKTWLKELENELKKNFYEDEVEDIVSYYQEMIEDRRASGEHIDDILSDYHVKEIVKTMTPNVLMKRSNKTYRAMTKSTKQLIIVLLSTPFLLPLGIVYISLLIFAFSMMLVSGILIVSSFLGIIWFSGDLIQSSLNTPNVIGLVGFAIMMFSLLILTSIWTYQIVWYISKKMLYWFSSIARRKGELR